MNLDSFRYGNLAALVIDHEAAENGVLAIQDECYEAEIS